MDFFEIRCPNCATAIRFERGKHRWQRRWQCWGCDSAVDISGAEMLQEDGFFLDRGPGEDPEFSLSCDVDRIAEVSLRLAQRTIERDRERKASLEAPVVLWSDAIQGPEKVFPHVARMPDGQRVERASIDGDVIPVVVLRASTFRSELTSETPVQVVMDVVSVFPYPSPIAYVLSIVFDDVEDPFFYIHALHPVPPATVNDTAILREEVQATRSRARTMVMDFCGPSRRCGLIVIGQDCEVLLHRVVTVGHGLEDRDPTRNAEIREVVEFLDDFEVHRNLQDLEAASKNLLNTFWLPIRGPDGVYRSIPPNRSTIKTDETVFPLRVRDGRLVRRFEPKRPDTMDFDLFFAHAHVDAAATEAIREWIVDRFPGLRTRMTGDDSEEEFAEDPRYFLLDSMRSACLVYVATENSANRLMVQTEISHNAHKPIFTLLAGNLTRADIELEIRTNPFIRLDRDRIFDLNTKTEWSRLSKQLAEDFGLPPDKEILDVPTVLVGEDDRDVSERMADYRTDWMTISRAFARSQPRQEAVDFVTEEARKLHEAGHIEEPPLGTDPEGLLLMILAVTQQTLVPWFLDRVPALVNDYLVRFAQEIASQCEAAGEDPAVARHIRYVGRCAKKRLEPVDPDVVWSLLERLVLCQSRGEAEQLTVAHSHELLSEEADLALGTWLRSMTKSPEKDSERWQAVAHRVARTRDILRDCRERGIESVFAQLGDQSDSARS